MSYLSSLFTLFGGLGMFLYGMTVMSDGMQKAASSKMSKFLNIGAVFFCNYRYGGRLC